MNPPNLASLPYGAGVLRRLKADQTVRDHALLASGAMAIPIPLLDMAAETTIQIRMVSRLCALYGVDFAEHRLKTVIAGVLSGISAGWVAGRLMRYASFASYFSNFWPSALFTGGITYAIGQVFIEHFESGGGIHDLNARKAAGLLRRKFQSPAAHTLLIAHDRS